MSWFWQDCITPGVAKDSSFPGGGGSASCLVRGLCLLQELSVVVVVVIGCVSSPSFPTRVAPLLVF